MARDYGKGGSESKVISPIRSAGKISGGGTNGPSGSPPRGGVCSYPKGGPCNAKADWDPMRKPASTYGLNGV